MHRQTFATLVYRVHTTAALPPPLVNAALMPPLLRLAEDKVPNVRLAVARTLSLIDAETDYYKSNQQTAASEEGAMTEERAAEMEAAAKEDNGSDEVHNTPRVRLFLHSLVASVSPIAFAKQKILLKPPG